MTIRKAENSDIPEIIKLYDETVRAVNSKDYNKQEVEVWASSAENPGMWKNRIAEQYFIVAEAGGMIVGFSSIASDGYLDYMYVHKDYQRKGAARKLLEEIELKAVEQKNIEIYSHVSRTAKGFFEKNGYIHSGDKIDPFRGVVFVNSIMKKKINIA